MLIYDGCLPIMAYVLASVGIRWRRRGRIREVGMRCDECGIALFEAGDVAPAGVYTRVDDGSFRRVTLERAGPLPASFDGHVAEYRAAATCVCERRHAAVALTVSARGRAPEKPVNVGERASSL